MNVWITKYALTKGILEIEAELCDSPGMIKDQNNGWNSYYHGEGKDWHKSKEAAIERAEYMRQNKLKSIRTKINKLQKLTFS